MGELVLWIPRIQTGNKDTRHRPVVIYFTLIKTIETFFLVNRKMAYIIQRLRKGVGFALMGVWIYSF